MSERLTVVITCKDERSHIAECVASARAVADEILVADSGSTDGTLELLRAMPDCRVVEREYVNAGDFKNWAIPQARHPWVLVLDADERITPELASEVRKLLSGEPRHDGYTVARANYFLGRRIRFSGWGGDRKLRLFRRDRGRFAVDVDLTFADHAVVEVAGGNVGRLRGGLVHYSTASYEQMLHKLDRYTYHQALAWRRAGRRPSLLKLVLNGPLRFLHAYVIRGGFLDGAAGLQVCALTGVYSFLKQARLWELHYGAPNGSAPKGSSSAGSAALG